MSKKSRSNYSHQPNAPELVEILQQPPHNPYYSDANAYTPLSRAPPPYSQLPLSTPPSAAIRTVPMSQLNDISYPRLQHGTSPVIIQAPGVPYDYRAEKYRRRIRSFNTQVIFTALLVIVLSIWAFKLYEGRPCFNSFVVQKVSNGPEIKISDVRDSHLGVAAASGIVIIMCLIKCMIGFRGKSHSCYLFIIALFTFAVTLYNVYVAYLAFYSPCVLPTDLETSKDFIANIFKTSASKVLDSVPPPQRGDASVIDLGRHDPSGVVIFVLDVINCIFYFAIFLTSTMLC